jgi:hypothetical protein
MNDFAEKRSFHRMGVEAPAQYILQGAEEIANGRVKNLSAAGLLLLTSQEISPGTKLSIHIVPSQPITPPFSASLSVVRSNAADGGGFEIACSIERILAQDEAESLFP